MKNGRTIYVKGKDEKKNLPFGRIVFLLFTLSKKIVPPSLFFSSVSSIFIEQSRVYDSGKVERIVKRENLEEGESWRGRGKNHGTCGGSGGEKTGKRYGI